MSQEIRNLEPKALWNKFADLNAVPRPSKKRRACNRVYEKLWK
jgi:di/tripeptidase